jgi:hypothetical protein
MKLTQVQKRVLGDMIPGREYTYERSGGETFPPTIGRYKVPLRTLEALRKKGLIELVGNDSNKTGWVVHSSYLYYRISEEGLKIRKTF